jgi:hypothetical protein
MVSPIDNFVHKGTDVFLTGHAADGTRYVPHSVTQSLWL